MLLAASSASLSQPVITNQPQTQAVAPGGIRETNQQFTIYGSWA